MEMRAPALWMSGIGPEDDRPSELAMLLERAATGDVFAFEQILFRYERRVFSLAWRLLGLPEDAQDASQEVFLRTFRHLRRYDRSRPFEPWLMKMTVNVCHDLANRRHRHPQGVIDPDLLRGIDDPHGTLHSEEQKKLLHAALQELPEKERTAIVLRDIEGLSTAEVAEILGSSEGTVRSQVSNARIKIRKSLQRGRL